MHTEGLSKPLLREVLALAKGLEQGSKGEVVTAHCHV